MDTLKVGSKGINVRLLQSVLVKLDCITAKDERGRTNIDGFFGDGTKSGVNAWKKSRGKPQDGQIDEFEAAELGFFKLPPEPRSEHFTLAMFETPAEDNDDVRKAKPLYKRSPTKYWPNAQKLMNKLEVELAYVNKRLGYLGEIRYRIYSGYRDPVYNAAVDGEDGSLHMMFMAADYYAELVKPDGTVVPYGFNNFQLAKVGDEVDKTGGRGLGNRKIIHRDIRRLPTIWWYSNANPAKPPQYIKGAHAHNWAVWEKSQ
jgi:peptidoglycan hydrolase-like protein with peptidoglycan-binding domain